LKKLAIAGIVLASALTLTACGSSSGYNGFSDGYSTNGGYTDHDWDMNYPSIWNNNTYCHGGTYQPLAGNQYSCINNGVTSRPTVRPKAPIVPPKAQQAPPPAVLKQRQESQQKKQNSAPKTAQKAPAYKAPARTSKTGK